MSQNKSTENSKTAEAMRANGNKAAAAADGMAESGKATLREVGETAERHADKGMDVALQSLEDTGKQIESASRSSGELASFWLQTMQEQATHNIEAMHEIAAARDWQDKLAVQSNFFSGSLQRLQDVFARYMAMTGDLQHGALQAGAANGKKAGKAAAAA